MSAQENNTDSTKLKTLLRTLRDGNVSSQLKILQKISELINKKIFLKHLFFQLGGLKIILNTLDNSDPVTSIYSFSILEDVVKDNIIHKTALTTEKMFFHIHKQLIESGTTSSIFLSALKLLSAIVHENPPGQKMASGCLLKISSIFEDLIYNLLYSDPYDIPKNVTLAWHLICSTISKCCIHPVNKENQGSLMDVLIEGITFLHKWMKYADIKIHLINSVEDFLTMLQSILLNNKSTQGEFLSCDGLDVVLRGLSTIYALQERNYGYGNILVSLSKLLSTLMKSNEMACQLASSMGAISNILEVFHSIDLQRKEMMAQCLLDLLQVNENVKRFHTIGGFNYLRSEIKKFDEKDDCNLKRILEQICSSDCGSSQENEDLQNLNTGKDNQNKNTSITISIFNLMNSAEDSVISENQVEDIETQEVDSEKSVQDQEADTLKEQEEPTSQKNEFNHISQENGPNKQNSDNIEKGINQENAAKTTISSTRISVNKRSKLPVLQTKSIFIDEKYLCLEEKKISGLSPETKQALFVNFNEQTMTGYLPCSQEKRSEKNHETKHARISPQFQVSTETRRNSNTNLTERNEKLGKTNRLENREPNHHEVKNRSRREENYNSLPKITTLRKQPNKSNEGGMDESHKSSTLITDQAKDTKITHMKNPTLHQECQTSTTVNTKNEATRKIKSENYIFSNNPDWYLEDLRVMYGLFDEEPKSIKMEKSNTQEEDEEEAYLTSLETEFEEDLRFHIQEAEKAALLKKSPANLRSIFKKPSIQIEKIGIPEGKKFGQPEPDLSFFTSILKESVKTGKK